MLFPALFALGGAFFFLVLRVQGTDGSFPKPLPPDKEAELLRKMQEEGDEKAREQLIEHNLRLVAHIVKKDYCKGLIRPAENGLKPAAPVSDRSLNGFACHCFAPAPQYDPESLPQLQSESRL